MKFTRKLIPVIGLCLAAMSGCNQSKEGKNNTPIPANPIAIEIQTAITNFCSQNEFEGKNLVEARFSKRLGDEEIDVSISSIKFRGLVYVMEKHEASISFTDETEILELLIEFETKEDQLFVKTVRSIRGRIAR